MALLDLRDRGCAAAGYRLGGAVLDHVCCRHLFGADRMLIAWTAADHAVVVAIGPHDESTEDVYAVLLDALGLDRAEGERDKPPCCDDAGQPPVEPEIAGSIADALQRRRRSRRRASRRRADDGTSGSLPQKPSR